VSRDYRFSMLAILAYSFLEKGWKELDANLSNDMNSHCEQKKFVGATTLCCHYIYSVHNS
jgi:hypothetical protein